VATPLENRISYAHTKLVIFDAHLDLAMNVRRGRDITRPASEQPVVENEIATVGLPDLVAAV
jgi:hypothetical protein